MYKVEFPDEKLVAQLFEAGKLAYVLDTLGTYLENAIAQRQYETGSVKDLVTGYLRSSSNPVICSAILRRAVFWLVFEGRVVRNSAVEILWDVLLTYGPSNVATTVAYLDASPTVLRPKMGRYLEFLANSTELLDVAQDYLDRVAEGMLVLCRSSYASLITPEFLVCVNTGSPIGRVLHSVCRKSSVSADVRALCSMFPQLTVKHAQALLQKSPNLEDLTQKVLDDPKLLEMPRERKKYVRLDRSERETTPREPNFVQKTLALIEAMDEDEEPDDGVAEASIVENSLSDADKKTSLREQLLITAFTEAPSVLRKASRKSKARLELKSQTGWTDEQIEGWATMVDRDTALEDKLRHRYRIQRQIGPRKVKHPRQTQIQIQPKTQNQSDLQTDTRTKTQNQAITEQTPGRPSDSGRRPLPNAVAAAPQIVDSGKVPPRQSN